ncbi:Alpha/Beta hydrolase protein [Halenospora varia]|nr:Alpha/Beta hydrolase protein [Halenospora varia]
MQFPLASILLLATLVQSTPLHASKSCREYTIPLNVTSDNHKWALAPLENNYDMTAFNTDLGRRDTNSAFIPITLGTVTETATYTVSGTFCEPIGGGNGTVLLATHGGGYDRSYWDPKIQPEKYSFVDFAIAKGYSIFFYDRIGVGKSERVSGYVAQVSNQAVIVEKLSALIRSGKFCSRPSKLVLVGHSLGSAISNAVLHSNPGLVDAAVLTGFSYYGVNSSPSLQAKQLRLASLQNPAKWSRYDGGYSTWVDIYANIEGFFKAPFYDPSVAQYTEDTKQPSGLVETITVRTTNLTSPDFTGPVMVISGEYDFLACGGYCPGVLEMGANTTFPASKSLVTYPQPGSGHAINFSLNATGLMRSL